jgi:disulfide bond formation protein DsbB
MNSLRTFLSSTRNILLFFAIVSAAALGTAFISQYVYGLQPCELCIYQRWPYGIVIAVGLIGAAIAGKSPKAASYSLGLTALIFFIEAVIAFYHTGVERKWWPSFLEGCSVPEMKGNITDVLAQIAATPAVRCDEIPWTDPILGWSMANYNVIAALGLTMLAVCAFKLSYKK